MNSEEIWKENWKWIAYLTSNNLLTQYIENCSNMDKFADDNSRLNDFDWEYAPEGEIFWNKHWLKAMNE